MKTSMKKAAVLVAVLLFISSLCEAMEVKALTHVGVVAYYIIDQNGLYLTISSDQLGAELTFSPYDSTKGRFQKFILAQAGDGFEIRTLKGLLLDYKSYNPRYKSETIWVYSPNDNDQTFVFESDTSDPNLYKIVSQRDSRRLSLESTNNKASFSNSHQSFRLEKTWFYDRQSSVSFVEEAYSSNYQVCVSLGSSALYVGGVDEDHIFAQPSNAKGSCGVKANVVNVKDFWTKTVTTGIGTAEKINFSDQNTVSNQDIREGDILIVRTKTQYIHLAVINQVERTTEGYKIYFCQRNPSRKGKQLTNGWSSCFNKDASVYVIKING